MKEDLKSFCLAIVLSLIVIFISNRLLFNKETPVLEQQNNIEVEAVENKTEEATIKTEDIAVEDVLAMSPRIEIDNNSVNGSIRVKGVRIDNLTLKKYKQTLETN